MIPVLITVIICATAIACLLIVLTYITAMRRDADSISTRIGDLESALASTREYVSKVGAKVHLGGMEGR